MPNLAMRQPGTQFSGDGLNLSWPLGGEREVVEVPDDEVSLRVRRRIAEGSIVITDEAPNKVSGSDAREYRLLTGDEARRHFDEPAGPVTRVVYHPATPEDERGYQLEVQEAQMNSDTFIKAQEARAQQAEEKHAEIGRLQAAAEKEAAKAKGDEDEDDEDPLAERLRRTEEASADWAADREKQFMERETERQKEENAALKAAPKPAKEKADTGADKAFMEAEKARQKEEAEVEKQRQKAAKDATPAPVVNGGWGGKTDPHIDTTSVGRKPAATITASDKTRPPAKAPAKSKAKSE